MTRPFSYMIAFLIGSKFPDHRWLRDPDRPRVRRAGTNPPDLPEEQRGAALAELQAYEAELSAKPLEEIRALFNAEGRRQSEEARRRRQARTEADERNRFFNRASADADFDHWSKAAYWTIDEGIALLLGKAPDVVNWDSVADYVAVSPFARRYAKLRDLALRAQRSGQLAQRIEPLRFLDWANRNGIAMPVDLQERVKVASGPHQPEASASAQSAESKARPEGKTLQTRERDTLLKLVIGMAVTKYKFDPQATRSTAISEIVDDLASSGITLDPKTVRKWLSEATDLLPRELDDGR